MQAGASTSRKSASARSHPRPSSVTVSPVAAASSAGTARRIERGRRHADAVDHVVEDPVGQLLGVVVEAVQCSLAHVVNPSPVRDPRLDGDGQCVPRLVHDVERDMADPMAEPRSARRMAPGSARRAARCRTHGGDQGSPTPPSVAPSSRRLRTRRAGLFPVLLGYPMGASSVPGSRGAPVGVSAVSNGEVSTVGFVSGSV